MPAPSKGPMPGMSPCVWQCVKRPPMTDVIVVVHSLTAGSVPGAIHIFTVPFHVPTDLARCSCCLPGVAAAVQAAMSASLIPGGGVGVVGFFSGCVVIVAGLAVGVAVLVSLGGWARAMEPAHSATNRAVRLRL